MNFKKYALTKKASIEKLLIWKMEDSSENALEKNRRRENVA